MAIAYVAEISGNHGGSYSEACKLVTAAAEAGATHLKIQTFDPDQMVGDPDYVVQDGPWAGRRLLDLYRETHTPREWHADLFEVARYEGLIPMSSPFHPDDVDFLETLDCSVYKIASLETGYTDLLQAVKGAGKEVFVSTGTLSYFEVYELIRFFGDQAVYLKCTSAYPADPADANLRTLNAWRADCRRVGLSDHTPGCGVAVAAAVLGAEVIEKHLMLPGCKSPDSGFSLLPDEFRAMVDACEAATAALGSVVYGTASESSSKALRRGLWWARDVHAGEIVSRDMVKVARPAEGMTPETLPAVVGSTLNIDALAGTPVDGVGFDEGA